MEHRSVVEDLEREEAERHLEEVSVARVAAARSHHGWIELDSEDLVARPPGYFVAVSTDDYFTQARGTVFESGSANVIATESQLHFAVDASGNITFWSGSPDAGATSLSAARHEAGHAGPEEKLMQTALIQIARVATAETLQGVKDRTLNPEHYVRSDGLSLLRTTGVPLIVDHDMTRQVGVVEGLYALDTPDGRWVCARATVTDAPSWLRKGTSCSYGLFPIHRRLRAGWVASGFVKEVSILSSAHTPVEPLARIAVLKRILDAPLASATSSAGRAAHHGRPADDLEDG